MYSMLSFGNLLQSGVLFPRVEREISFSVVCALAAAAFGLGCICLAAGGSVLYLHRAATMVIGAAIGFGDGNGQ